MAKAPKILLHSFLCAFCFSANLHAEESYDTEQQIPSTELADVIETSWATAFARTIIHLGEAKTMIAKRPKIIDEWTKEVQPKLEKIAQLRTNINVTEHLKFNLEEGLASHPENQSAIDSITESNAKAHAEIVRLENQFDEQVRKKGKDPFQTLFTKLLINDPLFKGEDGGLRYKVDSVFYRHEAQLGGALLWDEKEKIAIVAFLGTSSGIDWAHNFLGIGSMKTFNGVNWHGGFYEMWRDSLGSLSFRLEKLLSEKDQTPSFAPDIVPGQGWRL